MFDERENYKEFIELTLEHIKDRVSIFYSTIENYIVLNEYVVNPMGNFLKEYLGFEETEVTEFTKEIKEKVLEQFKNETNMSEDSLNWHIFYRYKDFVLDKLFNRLMYQILRY